jgi:hypothetical protein
VLAAVCVFHKDFGIVPYAVLGRNPTIESPILNKEFQDMASVNTSSLRLES